VVSQRGRTVAHDTHRADDARPLFCVFLAQVAPIETLQKALKTRRFRASTLFDAFRNGAKMLENKAIAHARRFTDEMSISVSSIATM